MQSERAIGGDPYVGTTVAGRFSVTARVGSGGMGTVYAAEQTPLGRPVALKLLKEEVAWDAETVTRFHREAKAMSLLQSPHTVRVYDFGQTESGILFLAMELLEGETLTERVHREGALSPTMAIRVVQQILSSLQEAHSKGIIHRDLKPDNIVLVDGDDGQPLVKVLDFGIAKVFEGENDFDSLETQAGTVFGTPRYMSPEQAQGKKLDARSDLYSVGVLLYQALTGVPPFQDDDAVVVMAQHIRDAATPPMEMAPTRPITPRLNKAVMRALAKTPDKRFQNATAFGEALEKCIPELASYRAGQTGIFGAASSSRRRSVLIAAAVLLLCGLVGGALAWFPGNDGAGEAEMTATTGQGTQTPTAAEAPPEQAPVIPEELPTRVESDPAGAEVWVDGESMGITPFTFQLAPDSITSIELRLEEHEAQTLELHAGQSERITLTPEPRRRRVRRPATDTPAAMEAAPSSMRDGYSRLNF